MAAGIQILRITSRAASSAACAEEAVPDHGHSTSHQISNWVMFKRQDLVVRKRGPADLRPGKIPGI